MHRDGFAQVFVHYLLFNMGQVQNFMDKYLMAIYLSWVSINFCYFYTSAQILTILAWSSDQMAVMTSI